MEQGRYINVTRMFCITNTFIPFSTSNLIYKIYFEVYTTFHAPLGYCIGSEKKAKYAIITMWNDL
jgi:hypothetical protein